MDIPPDGGRDGGGRATGGGYLRLPPLEHSRTTYCNQFHNGPVSGGGVETKAMGIQVVVGAGINGCGRDVDVRLGDVTERGGGGDGRDRDGNILVGGRIM